MVDWTVHQQGPFATAMLADLGADVIHVEWKGVGDLLRGTNPLFGLNTKHSSGRQVNFEEHNRNKRGIAIDLKQPAGKEIMYRLVEKSDVFLTNFRLEAVERLGMDYETLSQRNPRLVYTVATGIGEFGPEAKGPTLDVLGQARSGALMHIYDEPIMGIPGVGDRGGAVFAAYATLAALFARERYGIGQRVVCSMLGSLIVLQGASIMLTSFNQRDYAPWNRGKANNPLYNFYQTKDKKWVALAAMLQHEWRPFCEMIGMPELADDPKYATLEGRKEHCEELIALVDEVIASKTRDEWTEIAKEHDMLYSPINRLSELHSDPQVRANEYITTLDHPEIGPFKMVGFPFSFSETPPTFRTPAPELGQHTEEVLLEIGYTWDDISRLRDAEVI